MSELNPIGETPEVEPTEQVEISETQEQQALDDATFEPEAHVEQTGEFAEAEAIEATFVEVVENTAGSAEDVGVVPIPLPEPAEDVGVVPIPLPEPAEDVGVLPVPLPEPAEDVGVLPIPLPEPAEGVSASPIPLPEPAEEIFGPENLDYNEASQQVETLDDKGLEDVEQ